MTYCWEQNDDATSIGATQSLPSATKTDGPNFRSYPPTTSPVRYFPRLADQLNGQLTTTWETVSTVARNLNFALTVRDNVLAGGQTNSDAMLVTVSASAGPLKVTSQSSSVNWVPGTTETITWNVANTTSLTGAANVNIRLSIDGGLTYDTLLATNVTNDGSQDITVPNVSSLNCRVMVEPTGNIFYAINSRAFTIGANCNTFTLTPNVAIADGTAANVAGATTTSVINVPVGVTISNMKVNLKIDHQKIGDLVVKIAHPDGTIRTLWNRTCNSTTYTGIDITFADGSGTIVCGSPASGIHNASQSASAFAGFNGKSTLGNWTLTVTDNNINNTGTLVSWGVDFGCTLATPTNQLTDFTIYPNPNRGNFNIQFDNTTSNEIKVNVFDMRGRKIFENKYSNQATFNENIQLNNAQSGVYLVSVTDGNQKIVKRIVIE